MGSAELWRAVGWVHAAPACRLRAAAEAARYGLRRDVMMTASELPKLRVCLACGKRDRYQEKGLMTLSNEASASWAGPTLR
jgi:hypothetical protein